MYAMLVFREPRGEDWLCQLSQPLKTNSILTYCEFAKSNHHLNYSLSSTLNSTCTMQCWFQLVRPGPDGDETRNDREEPTCTNLSNCKKSSYAHFPSH